MKRIFLSFCLMVTQALAQVPVPPAATPAEVTAGTDRYKYLTPYALAQAGITGGGGGGAAVSNAFALSFVLGTTYTNTTGHYADVRTRVEASLPASSTRNAIINWDVDIENDNSFVTLYRWAHGTSGGSAPQLVAEDSFGGIVPPGAVFRFVDASSLGGTVTLTASKGQIVYYSTNSGSGGAGDVTQAGLAAGDYPIEADALTGTASINTTGNAASATNLVFTNTLTRWVDATNGNDSNPGTFAQPWRTMTNAVARATNAGQWIILNPGVFNVGTNPLRVAHGVNVGGSGEILSAIDLNNGVALNPGSYSEVRDITITCDTNTVYTMFDASTHSGYWGAFGVSTINGNFDKAFTNTVARNLTFKNCSTDGFYWYSPTNRPSSLTAYDCRVLTFFDAVAGDFNTGGQNETNTTATFLNCHFEVNGVGAHPDITFGQGSIHNGGRGNFNFLNCTGVSTNEVAPANAAFFSGVAGATLNILGGRFEVEPGFPIAVGAGSLMNGITGRAMFNSTNLTIGKILLSTNANPLLNTRYTNGPGQAQFYGSFNFSGGGDAASVMGVTYNPLTPAGTTNFWSKVGLDDSGGSSFVVADFAVTFPVGPNEAFYLQTGGNASLIVINTNNWKLVVK